VKIYTRTGDKGETSLFGGRRVPKNSLRIEAFGTVDELNSALGVCRALKPRREIGKILEQIQRDLFSLGADLATPDKTRTTRFPQIGAADVSRLERHIDAVESKLAPLRKFILPGGSGPAAMIHFARTICRRAERGVVELSASERPGPFPVIYLNRLSDLLFVLARWENAHARIAETKWSA
jgi:cob(I)alamin adenosyltransferase